MKINSVDGTKIYKFLSVMKKRLEATKMWFKRKNVENLCYEKVLKIVTESAISCRPSKAEKGHF